MRSVTLRVQIKTIRYPNIQVDEQKRAEGEDKLFYIIDATLPDNSTLPIKGMLMARPAISERFDVTGKFTTYQGLRQFSFDFASPVVATNKRELLKYACEITSGFGDVLEGEIWDRYGETWDEDIKPNEIRGINENRLNALRETLEKLKLNAERTRVISWLISNGLSVNLAEKAVNLFGNETQAIIEKDCYQLIRVDGVGFAMVDNNIRHFFHVEDDDDIRVDAAILYAMQTLAERGDTLIDWNLLQTEVFNMLKCISCDRIAENVSGLFAKGQLVGFSSINKIALAKHYKAECIIYDFIRDKEKDDNDLASLFLPVTI